MLWVSRANKRWLSEKHMPVAGGYQWLVELHIPELLSSAVL